MSASLAAPAARAPSASRRGRRRRHWPSRHGEAHRPLLPHPSAVLEYSSGRKANPSALRSSPSAKATHQSVFGRQHQGVGVHVVLVHGHGGRRGQAGQEQGGNRELEHRGWLGARGSSAARQEAAAECVGAVRRLRFVSRRSCVGMPWPKGTCRRVVHSHLHRQCTLDPKWAAPSPECPSSKPSPWLRPTGAWLPRVPSAKPWLAMMTPISSSRVSCLPATAAAAAPAIAARCSPATLRVPLSCSPGRHALPAEGTQRGGQRPQRAVCGSAKCAAARDGHQRPARARPAAAGAAAHPAAQ